MEPALIDSLTSSERSVLRQLLRERDQKAVAKVLGISPETVKTHLRNAREKCGAQSSFTLAKALAEHEGSHPSWGMTPKVVGRVAVDTPIESLSTHREMADGAMEEFREVRASFDFTEGRVSPMRRRLDRDGAPGTGFGGLLKIGAVVFLLITAIILAFPLSESFQRLANMIDSPTH